VKRGEIDQGIAENRVLQSSAAGKGVECRRSSLGTLKSSPIEQRGGQGEAGKLRRGGEGAT